MITKRRILFLIGILIVLNSILFGLSFVYESFLNIILGLSVIVITFLFGGKKSSAHHHKHMRKREQAGDVFAENNPKDGRDESDLEPHLEPIPEENKIES